jgi:2-polyprenyl-3-methyl-5-hydroxy-6-metoxy-1,4-benzoquinol methylase
MNDELARELNRAHWNALAAVHGQDEYYDSDGSAAGRVDLGAAEQAAITEAVGDLRGRDVLHLQCHIGFDAIAIARRGARVTALDFSAASLEKARALSTRCGVEVEWVHADVTRLPAALKQRFDFVYATIGVLSWIEDVDARMHAAASALRAGGRLALVDIHPLYQMIAATDPLDLDFPYAFDGPRRFNDPGSYADRDAVVRDTATIQYGHSLGEIVTAAIAAGLRIQALHEHLDVGSDPRGDMLAPSADGRLRLEISGQRLPILFTLIAGRPSPP